jgi:hypothetical protein
VWLGSRLATLLVFWSSEHAVASDPKYYWTQLNAMVDVGSAEHTLREYPLPAIATMLFQFAVTYGHRSAFVAIFVASTLLADAIFTAVLWRAREPGARHAAWFWIAFVPLLGPVALFRFDVFPSILTAVALMRLASAPRVAGAMLGFAAAIKAWPALVLPSAMRPPRSRRGVLWAFGLVAGVACLVTVAAAGLRRLVSPLTWQSARGLQIESLAATPLMVARRVGAVDRWPIRMHFYAWQLTGPGTRLALLASTVFQIGAVVVVTWLYVRLYRARGAVSADALRWSALASVLVFVVVNKTLSPQYLLWVAALVAVALLSEPNQRTNRFAAVVLAVAVATHGIFPWLYGRMIAGSDPGGIGVALLVARNLTLLGLAWYATRTAFRAVGDHIPGRARSDEAVPNSYGAGTES